MDLSYGTVYCFVCNDYVYDAELECISTSQHQRAAKAQGMCHEYLNATVSHKV